MFIKKWTIISKYKDAYANQFGFYRGLVKCQGFVRPFFEILNSSRDKLITDLGKAIPQSTSGILAASLDVQKVWEPDPTGRGFWGMGIPWGWFLRKTLRVEILGQKFLGKKVFDGSGGGEGNIFWVGKFWKHVHQTLEAVARSQLKPPSRMRCRCLISCNDLQRQRQQSRCASSACRRAQRDGCTCWH